MHARCSQRRRPHARTVRTRYDRGSLLYPPLLHWDKYRPGVCLCLLREGKIEVADPARTSWLFVN